MCPSLLQITRFQGTPRYSTRYRFARIARAWPLPHIDHCHRKQKLADRLWIIHQLNREVVEARLFIFPFYSPVLIKYSIDW
jgi:hypothetical protein